MTGRKVGDYKLTEKQQETWNLSQQGLTHEQIAEKLGVSLSLISKRMRRIKRLRESQQIAEAHEGIR